MRHSFTLFALPALLCAAALAAPPATPPVHPVLVELFTSEGCSSCPPADALLRKLQGQHTAAGQWIVAISEHVTYWNQLGWSDPFSRDAFTERQSIYGDRFHLASVYTPQVVVNGSAETLGSDESAILHAVASTDRPSSLTVDIGSVSLNSGKLTVTFSVGGSSPLPRTEINAVIADDTAVSHVLRGENAGRTLAHVSVAQGITRVATLSAPATRIITLENPSAPVNTTTSGRHLILFAQEPDGGRVLAIATRPL